jgi:hypothetical protein
MEKKVTKKFYLLSLLNLVTVGILGQGHLIDTGVLAVILMALMVNHTVLVRLIAVLATSLSGTNDAAKKSLPKVLGLMFLKMMILGAILVLVYFYKPGLVLKVIILMIFQLIIQVVSIKNNY